MMSRRITLRTGHTITSNVGLRSEVPVQNKYGTYLLAACLWYTTRGPAAVFAGTIAHRLDEETVSACQTGGAGGPFGYERAANLIVPEDPSGVMLRRAGGTGWVILA